MQVFVPYPSFARSVAVLDNARLGNGIYREVLTLIRGGWPHHPASRAWQGHFWALSEYALAGLEELARRGRYYPHHWDTFLDYRESLPHTGMPAWWGREDICISHQSNLIRKSPEHYGPLFPGVPSDLPYIWPV